MKTTSLLLWSCVAVSALVACSGASGASGYQDMGEVPGAGASSGSGGGASSGAAGGASSGAQSCGLPADVQAILATSCTSCHSDPPVAAPMPLVTLAELTAPDKANPSISAAQASLARMQATGAQLMPPGQALSASDVATFAAWVNGGAQPFCTSSGPGSSGASSGSGSGSGGASSAPTCTSGQYSHASEGYTMRPGEACNACHATNGGGDGSRTFGVAGTVYPTAHEPDDCLGAIGVQVILTDANGVDQPPLTTNSAGTFTSDAILALPYTARVVANGKTRAMATAQTSGDCNSCHTQSGASGAPGRIMAP